MAARGRIPPALEGRVVQAPGSMRHGIVPASHRLLELIPNPDLLENKIAAQAAEIERLAGDNHNLAQSQVVLRQDLAAAQQEAQKLQAHIRSMQTESDIQIRILRDKIVKMETHIRDGENVKNELKQVHMEAQSLVKSRQELSIQIQQASQELQKVQTDVRSLPDLHVELDNLRYEHRRLRATFEYEKGVNVEMVKQMEAMEQDLIGMAREVEKLHAEVLNTEKRAHAAPSTYGSAYVTPDPSFPPPFVLSGGAYVNAYGRHFVQRGAVPAGDMMVPYITGNSVAATVSVVPNAGGGAASRVPYDPSLAPL